MTDKPDVAELVERLLKDDYSAIGARVQAAATLTTLSRRVEELEAVLRECGRKAISAPDSKACCDIEKIIRAALGGTIYDKD